MPEVNDRRNVPSVDGRDDTVTEGLTGAGDAQQVAVLEAVGAERPRRHQSHARTRIVFPDPFGRVEGADGLVDGRDVAEVRPQSSGRSPRVISPGWARSNSTNDVHCQAADEPRVSVNACG
jgi:hypothetical protein